VNVTGRDEPNMKMPLPPGPNASVTSGEDIRNCADVSLEAGCIRTEQARAGIVPPMLAQSRLEARPALREFAVPAAVAAGGAAALVAKSMLLPVNMYDAGISASAGTFILHGLVPYRDFWMLYGTRYLVLDRRLATVCEPVNASCQPGASRLDDFIAAQSRTANEFGDIAVMVRP
jgi:hypothetical protein